MPVPAGVALLLLGGERELRQLLLPVDPAAHLDPPHPSRDGLYRSWERGISISAVQPRESMVVWTFQTGSQEKSAFPRESI